MTQPRSHTARITKPKPNPKVAAKKQQRGRANMNLWKTTKTTKKCGRSLDGDNDDLDLTSDEEESDEGEPITKKVRKTKRDEVEIVEDDVEPQEEEVENISADEVSNDSTIVLYT